MSKPIGAPAILEHNQPGAMQKAAADWKRKSNSVNGGKGSKPRTSLTSKAWQDNYDSIFRKSN
jgi:hypothetical protein